MARVETSKKACAVNPLKMSQPIGGALAFMGVHGCMPLLHGSQGCTSFGLVLFVRHFREAIPLQTTAMSEVATVLGGLENVEEAIVNIAKRAKPEVIGICSTGVTETKGDDVDGYIKLVRQRHPELDHMGIVYVSTPDFKDAFQDGWEKTVTKLIEAFVPANETPAQRAPQRVNVLARLPSDAGRHRRIARHHRKLRARADISCRTFPARSTVICPRISRRRRSAGRRARPWRDGLRRLDDRRRRADALAATTLERRAGVPFVLFDRLTGLAPNDELIGFLVAHQRAACSVRSSSGSEGSLSTRCSTATSISAASKVDHRRRAGPFVRDRLSG